MAVMEGRVHAANRELERDISIAWHTANFTRAKNLPELRKTLEKLRPVQDRAQTADEVAGIFLSLKAKGKSVKIVEVKR